MKFRHPGVENMDCIFVTSFYIIPPSQPNAFQKELLFMMIINLITNLQKG